MLSLRTVFHSHGCKCHLCAHGPSVCISVAQTSSLSTPDLKGQLFSFWSLHRRLKLSVPEMDLPSVSPAFLLPISKQHPHLRRCSSQKHRSPPRFIPYDPPPTINTSLEFISKVFSSLCLCCCHPAHDTVTSYLVTALVFQLPSLPSTRLRPFCSILQTTARLVIL